MAASAGTAASTGPTETSGPVSTATTSAADHTSHGVAHATAALPEERPGRRGGGVRSGRTDGMRRSLSLWTTRSS
ncbi:hypothetical protein [Streptomyces albidochromogenes]|uniref:hypothetical protein n=1 Tax=Streptomyces albidochromogenes TaxID=329524 RepID=UPI00142EC5AB|nr:hypothetical protein [Streptomyces albidochromogenes]